MGTWRRVVEIPREQWKAIFDAIEPIDRMVDPHLADEGIESLILATGVVIVPLADTPR